MNNKDESQERIGYTGMSIAEEMKSKFRYYSTAEGRKTILELCEDWSVVKTAVVTDGEEMPPTFRFEDGSTISLEDLSTGWWRVLNDEERRMLLNKAKRQEEGL
jgi:hypothetical protein